MDSINRQQAKKFVELIETMPFAKILKEPNAATKTSMQNAIKGKSQKHKSAKELIAFINKQYVFFRYYKPI